MNKLLSIPILNLELAAKDAGLEIISIAAQLSKSEKTIREICRGLMTIPQLNNFAKKVNKPFGFFLLDNPMPKYQPKIPDLRTRNKIPLSKNFFEIFKDISYKQEWYKDYLSSIATAELSFVGSFNQDSDITDIAKNMRKVIKWEQNLLSIKNFDEHFKLLCEKIEDVGILVMRNSIVIDKTNSRLDPEEFLGFCIVDKLAPVIFINSADKTSAKIFTLVHELAHIWLGVTAVSDNSYNNDIEKKCNGIAAEFLVPKTNFEKKWESNNLIDLDYQIESLSQIFQVSKMVIARVALTHNKISGELYKKIYIKQMEEIKHKQKQKKAKSGGPSAYVMNPVRNSKVITATVSKLLKRGDIDFKEASLLLNTKMNKVMNYV